MRLILNYIHSSSNWPKIVKLCKIVNLPKNTLKFPKLEIQLSNYSKIVKLPQMCQNIPKYSKYPKFTIIVKIGSMGQLMRFHKVPWGPLRSLWDLHEVSIRSPRSCHEFWLIYSSALILHPSVNQSTSQSVSDEPRYRAAIAAKKAV